MLSRSPPVLYSLSPSPIMLSILLIFGVCSAENILLNRYGLPPSEQAAFPIIETSPVQTSTETIAQGEENPLSIPINSRLSIQDQRLQYTHGFSDDSGTTVSEQGRLLSTNEGWEYVIVKKGSYSYISPEGVRVKVNYIADHNGFRIV
ncbi:uncharacterized protein LOC106673385 isoform X2 [Cimex lectularius]|uniref:Uncharacterized protein n=1 Tax=Cimex lectularius TaxID=79782 RepID=A0A8I6TMS7_CIMLE|nr:uncharacterized protein LOC106673385 isoform X2 [Cimex lectularius]XP_024085144.1 uncharacterized protein LOC106673385 isoform X2 [Cimex lectularius]XP_024085145.1 uncharacterized protein LOC106673385 isoform X2 [Cimex lectularius]